MNDGRHEQSSIGGRAKIKFEFLVSKAVFRPLGHFSQPLFNITVVLIRVIR